MSPRLIGKRYYLVCEVCGARRGPLPDRRELSVKPKL
jgi:hypothetical protein